MAHDHLIIHRPTRYAIPERTAPAQEPVTLAEMKAHGIVDSADEDANITAYLVAARRWVEGFTHRALITQTATYLIDRFPDDQRAIIELPGGSLQSVTSIEFTDMAGASQTWDASNYDVDIGHTPGRVSLAFEKEWPSVREWNLPITITYVVGYGADPADVPDEIRHAVKMITAELFMNREETVGGTSTPALWRAEKLANPHRIIRML